MEIDNSGFFDKCNMLKQKFAEADSPGQFIMENCSGVICQPTPVDNLDKKLKVQESILKSTEEIYGNGEQDTYNW